MVSKNLLKTNDPNQKSEVVGSPISESQKSKDVPVWVPEKHFEIKFSYVTGINVEHEIIKEKDSKKLILEIPYFQSHGPWRTLFEFLIRFIYFTLMINLDGRERPSITMWRYTFFNQSKSDSKLLIFQWKYDEFTLTC